MFWKYLSLNLNSKPLWLTSFYYWDDWTVWVRHCGPSQVWRSLRRRHINIWRAVATLRGIFIKITEWRYLLLTWDTVIWWGGSSPVSAALIMRIKVKNIYKECIITNSIKQRKMYQFVWNLLLAYCLVLVFLSKLLNSRFQDRQNAELEENPLEISQWSFMPLKLC